MVKPPSLHAAMPGSPRSFCTTLQNLRSKLTSLTRNGPRLASLCQSPVWQMQAQGVGKVLFMTGFRPRSSAEFAASAGTCRPTTAASFACSKS